MTTTRPPDLTVTYKWWFGVAVEGRTIGIKCTIKVAAEVAPDRWDWRGDDNDSFWWPTDTDRTDYDSFGACVEAARAVIPAMP